MKDNNNHLQPNNSETEDVEQKAIELTDLIDQNIESIVKLHVHAERDTSHHQRFIETATANLGRPRFFYCILLFVALWLSINLLLPHLGLRGFDPPPFSWLQGVVGLSALLMTTIVLITQNRQGRLENQHRQLNLQVSLLNEQKITKLIELIEELRGDLPSVGNRHDPQVEAMKEPVDPHKVIANLNQMFKEATDQ